MTEAGTDLLEAISRYQGADRIEDDTPEAVLATSLEDQGLIKVVTLGAGETVWKMTSLGLQRLKDLGRLWHSKS